MTRQPIDGSRRREILRATVVLLADDGYDKLTFDALARTAHASKATIYRHWASKLDLVVEALRDQMARRDDVDVGSLRGDLLDTVLDPEGLFQGSSFRAFSATFVALLRDPDAADAFVRTFLDDDPKISAIFDRAAERGEISVHADRDLLSAALFHGLLHLVVLRGAPMDTTTVTRVLDTLVLPAAAGQAMTRADGRVQVRPFTVEAGIRVVRSAVGRGGRGG